jgi:putative phosphoribosyl transferase
MPKNSNHKFFLDREDAATQLYDAIPKDFFQNREVIIIALSEGGVIVADTVAKKLGCTMDILLTESIDAPNNPELSIAKVSETQDIVIHKALIDAFGIDEEFVYKEAKRVYDDKILSHLYKYRKGASLQSVSGKAVILVDECVETDFTAIVAIKSMIGLRAKNIYMATPIMDEQSRESLTQISDGVFCPHQIRDYISIEYYYENLEHPTFSEIERIIEHYE